MTGRPAVSRRLVLDIFLLSGAAGLIYEVVWARQLVLVFGNTTQAVSAILTGFFGGMAIGSAVGGRVADRVRRPLRLYGLLELSLVAVVLLTPVSFRLLHEVYRSAFGSLEPEPNLLALVRFALALLALGPATVLMGATLPTLTRYLSQDAGHLSEAFGRLYAANTLGAIVGTILAGFVLIELVGLTGALLVGAACSGVSGLTALALDRRAGASERPPVALTVEDREAADRPDRTPRPATRSAAGPRSTLRIGLLVAFASGLTSLGYQTLWTRLLASGTGNLTYVFTLILVCFLVGIAFGAVTFSVLRPRITNTVRMLAGLQLATAVFVTLGAVVVLPGASSSLSGYMDVAADPGLLIRFFYVTILVVLPATLLMGLSFPAASGLVAGSDREVGRRAGLVLAVNTTGAIVGTFVIPFVIIPLIGSPDALGLLAIANTLLAVVLVLWAGLSDRVSRLVLGSGAALAMVLTIVLVTGGAFVDPSVAKIGRAGGVVVESLEDEIASVQGGRGPGGEAELWVTGTSMTLLTVDARLMPILPLIARPDARTALVVAFGMGSAFRSALNAGLATEAVELVPSVPKMFHVYYPDAAAVLADPNGRVIITDGRNHLELTDHRYDVIITDPPPPIESAGVSVISSREYYEAGRAHLDPSGVMMQWVPWGQSLDAFKAHVRTFRSVFPNVLIVFGPGGYGSFMLGSEAPLSLDPANVRAILARPGITADISSAYDSPEHDAAGWAHRIASLVWISGDQVARFAGDGQLITDDRPLPEYFLLHKLFGQPSPRVNPGLLRRLTPTP